MAATLALLPAFSVLGFAALAFAPTIAVIVAFQVLRRAGNFAIARPIREVLFTVVPREDRYKAKSFIDTVVYRLGDQAGAWSFTGIGALGLGTAGVSGVAVPLSILWFFNSLWLGRRRSGGGVEKNHHRHCERKPSNPGIRSVLKRPATLDCFTALAMTMRQITRRGSRR